jgi:hypothetical protein
MSGPASRSGPRAGNPDSPCCPLRRLGVLGCPTKGQRAVFAHVSGLHPKTVLCISGAGLPVSSGSLMRSMDSYEPDDSARPEDGRRALEHEALLIARAHRRLLEHTLFERRTLLVMVVVLPLVAVVCAIVGLREASAVAGVAGSLCGALLRIRPESPP